ncbi:MAG: HAD family phosphatase, partial [Gemmatimonadota bacterium]
AVDPIRERNVKRTILFDFNGVIVNDEPQHCQALLDTLRDQGITIGPDTYYRQYLGLDDRSSFRKALLEGGEQEPDEQRLAGLVDQKSARYRSAVGDAVTFVPGAREFIVLAVEMGCSLGLVSGALRKEIEPVLGDAGLAAAFECIVAAEDVSAGKPDPAGYRNALHLLASQPEHAMIVEDSLPGLAASRRAGVRCTMLTTSHPAGSFPGADAVWENFLGRTPADLPWCDG